MDLACEQCGQPVTIAPDPVGVPRYVHHDVPADGHKAELAPVTVTYRRDGAWTDTASPELGAIPPVMDLETARRMAAALLRRLMPARNVREVYEVHEGSGDG